MLEVLLLFLLTAVLAARSRRDLALENLVLRHQLQVALRTNPHPRLRARDRVLWLWLRQLWPDGWLRHLHVVQPETVLRWHRKGWRLYWTWKSRTKLGRPHLSAEVRELIARISKENPRWGTERIRGELPKLGIVVSNRSIRRYRRRRVRPGDSQLWRTFLVNQLRGIWAADLIRSGSFARASRPPHWRLAPGAACTPQRYPDPPTCDRSHRRKRRLGREGGEQAVGPRALPPGAAARSREQSDWP
jgi:hypothetical protein